jgi:polar amino acid transport system substrate-binding protein
MPLTLALLLALALVACGDDVESTRQSAASSTLVFGTDPTYPPLEFKEGGKLTGAEVELMEAVAGELGAKATFVAGDFSTLVPSLKAERFDAIAAGMFDTPDRRRDVLFVDFLGSPGLGALYQASKAPPDSDPQRLCDLTIAVGKGTGIADGPAPKLPKLTEDVCPAPVKSLILPNEPAAQLAVQSGRADAFMTSYMSVGHIAKTAGGGDQFKAVEYPDAREDVIAVAVRVGETALANQIKDAIQALMDNGRYQEVLADYGIEGMALDRPMLNRAP